MTPLKTKRLANIIEPPPPVTADPSDRVLRAPDKRCPTRKLSPKLHDRRRKSQRMAVVFNHAKNRHLPPTTIDNPVVVEPSENRSATPSDSSQTLVDEAPVVTNKRISTGKSKIQYRDRPIPITNQISQPQTNHHSHSPTTSVPVPPPESQPIQPPNHLILNPTTVVRSPAPPHQSQPLRSSNPAPLCGPPPPSFHDFNQSISGHQNTQPPPAACNVQQSQEQAANNDPAQQQSNVPVPERIKSIRVQFGEDEEEENRYRRGLVNGLRLEMHCHTLGGKVKVERDVDGRNPANENVRSLLTHDIGAYIKDRMPMLAEKFSKLPKHYRDDMINHLSLHFEIPSDETWLWDFIWRMGARRYSNWKSHCHTFYKEQNGALPAEFLWRPEQWTWLGGHFKDPKFIAKSIHCQNIRKKDKRLHHHLGKTTLAAIAKKYAKENHQAPHIAAFEEAYSADMNGSILVTQVKEKLQQLFMDRSVDDPGSVYDPISDEEQFAIINAVLEANIEGLDLDQHWLICELS